ncbi:MAG TPA: ribonuclease III [Acidimicrobiia bacterium]|jgi:ribonuclease-3
MTTQEASLTAFQQALGYTFDDTDLLRRALMHRSYASEHTIDDSYERLEFLGDAVLQLAVTRYLFVEHPELSEGEMAKVRAAVVNERALAVLARRFGVGDVILLGRGEDMTGGRDKSSILSDVVESVLGALYVEAGFERAATVIMSHWAELVEDRAEEPGRRDYKTRLQEELARRGLRPVYEVDMAGPEHRKHFTAKVYVNGSVLGSGDGTSKKRAEQAAARDASSRLDAAQDA